MRDGQNGEAELRVRVATLEAELARARREAEAWRTLFARTTRVLAAFGSDMDDMLRALRAGRPLTSADEATRIDAVTEPPDRLN